MYQRYTIACFNLCFDKLMKEIKNTTAQCLSDMDYMDGV